METITTKNTLKNVQASLTAQDKALETQQVMLFGADGTPNGKVPLSTQAVIDLKTGKPLADILDYNKPYVDSDLYVDMGLPSGTLWAKKNIDITQPDGFAASEYQYGCSFCSWGNTDMYNPNASNNFSGVYNWGTVNGSAPYYENQLYGSTPGNALTADFGPSHDAARRHLGAPWRIPSRIDFQELFNNCEYTAARGVLLTTQNNVTKTDNDKRASINGVVGVRLRSKINGNYLFFPVSGYGDGASLIKSGEEGRYCSSSFYSDRNIFYLGINSNGVVPSNVTARHFGIAVRPVQ